MTRFSCWMLVLVLAGGAAEARAQSATLAPAVASADVIGEVRAAIAKNDFAGGERILAAYRKTAGTTPEALEALSWLGRGALAASQLDRAETYALDTYDLAVAALKTRKMDDEPRLPIAIGAAIEVQANVLAKRGARSEAVQLLQQELANFRTTSIRTRIQKNINLLSLEGKAAPALDVAEYVGGKPATLAALKGKPVVLFFWAHWCPDCKSMSPVLEKLLASYGAQGLAVVAPTQRYGYVAARKSAPPAEEMAYITRIRDQNYPWLARHGVPVSEENFKAYGASTTPTVVVVDRGGMVRLYRPGKMTLEELEPLVRSVVEGKPGTGADRR